MGIRAKGGLGKLTGTATIIRKNGEREEVPISAKVTKEQVEKLAKSDKKKSN
jgi:hypothetical protein